MRKPKVLESSLTTWWLEHANVEAQQTVAKMQEYGSKDLIAVGHQVAALADRPGLSDDAAFEIGCLFYLIGKMERAVSAVQRGDLASSDTWFDIAVYAKMVLARRSGAWNG